jgi:hypothetical protein
MRSEAKTEVGGLDANGRVVVGVADVEVEEVV